MKRTLYLNKAQVREIIDYLNEHLPFEACGLLAGKSSSVEKILFVQNQAQSPVRFVMDPTEQLKAFDWIESHEMELLGIFHSHPSGPETVSATDIAEATYEVVHVVCSKANNEWKLRGFWIEDKKFEEVTLQLEN